MTAFAAVAVILSGFTMGGLYAAATIALAIGVLLIARSRRTNGRSLFWTGIALSVPSFCMLGLMTAGWLLFGIGPIYSAPNYPVEFVRMADIANADTSNAKVHGLGSFIDTEHVWRLTVSSEQLDRVIAEFGLVEVASSNVPNAFWGAFPRWWRPTHRASSRYLSTVGFPADSRGPDGDHCLTMYDSQNQQLYAWYKFNF
jgi:hypothetical protein